MVTCLAQVCIPDIGRRILHAHDKNFYTTHDIVVSIMVSVVNDKGVRSKIEMPL